MKLNKLERHTAYIIMLAEAESRLKELIEEGSGLCHLSAVVFGLYPIKKDLLVFYLLSSNKISWEEFMPELYAKRIPGELWWFPLNKSGWQQRIELLKQCIIETY